MSRHSTSRRTEPGRRRTGALRGFCTASVGRTPWPALVCALTMVGATMTLATPAAAAPGQWSVTPSPDNAGGGNDLVSVSCTSQSFCLALGGTYTDASGAQDTLVEEWDGTNWALIPGPSSPAGSPLYSLTSISCGSPNSCTAVGTVESPTAHFTGLQSDAATWDGTTWTLGPGGDDLNGSADNDVACPGAGTCYVVGVEWEADDFPIAPDGAVFSPAPYGLGALDGLSCPTVSFCMAVGSWNDFGSTVGPSVAVWGSQAPATVTAPPVSGSLGRVVACSGPGFCMVPGYAWDGSAWSAVASPGSVAQMSCASATDCTAVGGATIESWDGTTWTGIPNPSSSALLSGLSCTSASDCVAVGSQASGTLVETGTGTGTGPGSGPCDSSGTHCFTSGTSTTVAVSSSFSFAVTTSGTPTATITARGKLPRGVKFYKGSGQATLAGTPKSTRHKSSAGAYPITFTAKFGHGRSKVVVTQAFTLTVTS